MVFCIKIKHMKKILFLIGVSCVLNAYVFSQSNVVGNVGIGTSNPDSSALLHLESTTKGFLPPRLDSTQRKAVTNPANGLMVYDISLSQYWYYDSGIGWRPFCTQGSSGQTTVQPVCELYEFVDTLTTAEVNGCHNIPIILIPNADSNKIIEVLQAIVYVDFQTTAYATINGNPPDVSICFPSTIASPQFGTTNIYAYNKEGLGTTIPGYMACMIASTAGRSLVPGEPLIFTTSEPICCGDSPVRVHITYRIIKKF